MLHSQFVPHIVVTMLQNWLGLGHAAFVQKSWLDCGKSLLHTKLGSHHVFFAAMLHSPPHCGHCAPKLAGLGHAAFVQKSWLDCGKSLLHTKLGSQCCTHCLCPSLWSQCSKTGSVLAMQPLCRSHGWTVPHHVFFAAMLHSQFVPHIVVTMLQNWLGLGHTVFVQKS